MRMSSGPSRPARSSASRVRSLLWTRHREEPDLAPAICEWFESVGFERLYLSEPDAGYGVGVHRYVGSEQPLVAGEQLFSSGSAR